MAAVSGDSLCRERGFSWPPTFRAVLVQLPRFSCGSCTGRPKPSSACRGTQPPNLLPTSVGTVCLVCRGEVARRMPVCTVDALNLYGADSDDAGMSLPIVAHRNSESLCASVELERSLESWERPFQAFSPLGDAEVVAPLVLGLPRVAAIWWRSTLGSEKCKNSATMSANASWKARTSGLLASLNRRWIPSSRACVTSWATMSCERHVNTVIRPGPAPSSSLGAGK